MRDPDLIPATLALLGLATVALWFPEIVAWIGGAL